MRVVHKCGDSDNNRNGYNWTSHHMVEQAECFMDWFDEQFYEDPEYKEWVFPVLLFDNARVHDARPDDALNTTQLNVNPGGVQPKMKDGWQWSGSVKQTQSMQLPDGTPKGMKLILKERGYNVTGLKKQDLQSALSKEPDFVEDKNHNLLFDAIHRKNANAECLFTPKYHCELNPKEMHWNSSKRTYRNQQDFSNTKQQSQIMEQINQCLDNVPQDHIKKYIKESILYCEAYRRGATAQNILDKVKQLKAPRKSKRKVQTF